MRARKPARSIPGWIWRQEPEAQLANCARCQLRPRVTACRYCDEPHCALCADEHRAECATRPRPPAVPKEPKPKKEPKPAVDPVELLNLVAEDMAHYLISNGHVCPESAPALAETLAEIAVGRCIPE